MQDLDPSCGGLMPRIERLEAAPALRDDRRETWITRAALRDASLELARSLASARKRLVFLLAANNAETVIALLAAAAAGHAVALIDPSFPDDKLKALLEAYQPELVLGSPELVAKAHDLSGAPGSRTAEAAGVGWIERAEPATAPGIDARLALLLSTSGTTGGQKYVRLSGEAIAFNAGQIAEALRIDEHSVGIGHLPPHYSYGLSIITSHLRAGGRVYLLNDAIISPGFWSKIKAAGGSHFPGVPFHYATLARLGPTLVPDTVKVFTQAGGGLDPRIQAKISRACGAQRGRVFRHVRADRGVAAHDDAAARRFCPQGGLGRNRASGRQARHCR